MLLDYGVNDNYLKLSLELKGTSMSYNIEVVDYYTKDDKLYDINNLHFIIPKEDVELLENTSIDYIYSETGSCFVLDSPNLVINFDEEEDTDCCGRGCCLK